MLLWIFKLYRSTKAGLLSGDTAKQLAWGVALGVVLGLIPKGNLLAVSIAILMFCLSINHALAITTAALVMLGGAFLDPLSHRVGEALLINPTVRAVLAKLQTLPLFPWLSLNNTVVLGSFVIGLTIMTPAFWITLPVMKWWKRRLEKAETEIPPPAPVSDRQFRFDPPAEPQLLTHIDVVRLSRLPEDQRKRAVAEARPVVVPDANEALRYLVRHVKDTREEKVA